ncbi:head GIN domain-containing protein [Sunxiuqinia sp. A32]|uniref:head GIN domain-containing protein n=1 Tax=Sunxiuqinia sp. A32 TaxID=3461496 RepID=UPI0040451C95
MKKRLFHPFIAFLTITLLLTSCFLGPSIKGNGDVERQKRNLDNFSRIKTSNGLEVYLIPDTKTFAVIEADENLHNIIETEISGDVLKIYTHERIRWAKKKKVFVHYEQLEQLHSTTGSLVYTDGVLKSRDIELSANTGSQQSIELSCKYIDAKTSSGSHITLAGKAENAKLKASSGAHLKGSELLTKNCDADVSSGAHIYIKVDEDFNGEASSGGQIYYSGTPKNVKINTSSGGEIRKR